MTETPRYPPELQRVVDFHGHFCPGLLIGYRATELAMRLGGLARAGDEELVAICENKSCAVDAVQVMAGCTLGKGNLFVQDSGKQAFTFARRPSGEGLRVVFRAELRYGGSGQKLSREEFAALLLERPAEELFRWKKLSVELPPEAEIRETVICEACGEGVMDTRTRQVGGRRLCAECAAGSHPGGPAGPKS
jgi:formylmethanofuran dehydrogenase subunit E